MIFGIYSLRFSTISSIYTFKKRLYQLNLTFDIVCTPYYLKNKSFPLIRKFELGLATKQVGCCTSLYFYLFVIVSHAGFDKQGLIIIS